MCLNLFFATMAKDHVINANRIVKHIYLMEDILLFPNLAEDIIMGDMKLRFVFLIPEGSVAYSRQTVTRYTTPLGGTDAVECDQLAYAEFVIDYPDLFKPELLNICKAKVKSFKRPLHQSSKWDMVLEDIPQYYVIVPKTAMYVPSNGHSYMVQC